MKIILLGLLSLTSVYTLAETSSRDIERAIIKNIQLRSVGIEQKCEIEFPKAGQSKERQQCLEMFTQNNIDDVRALFSENFIIGESRRGDQKSNCEKMNLEKASVYVDNHFVNPNFSIGTDAKELLRNANLEYKGKFSYKRILEEMPHTFVRVVYAKDISSPASRTAQLALFHVYRKTTDYNYSLITTLKSEGEYIPHYGFDSNHEMYIAATKLINCNN